MEIGTPNVGECRASLPVVGVHGTDYVARGEWPKTLETDGCKFFEAKP